MRVGMPGPIVNGSTPRALQIASYSSLGSPRTNRRYPNGISRRPRVLIVPDFPRPGLPNTIMFGAVTARVSSVTQPIGSA